MRDLPWLIRAKGPEADRRRAERTERAARDLAAVAARIDGYLVLHEAVDFSFGFEHHHLPPGTVDLREGDPLGLVLDDPAAVVVTGVGIFIGTPIAHDPRWAQLVDLDRPRVLLATSGLSGTYFGCQVEGGTFTGKYRDGIDEQVVGVAARLVYEDGRVLVVEQTTIGYRTEGFERPLNSPSLATIVESVPAIPTQVTSELLDADELAVVLAEANRLPPETLTLNGRRWR